MLDQIDGGVFNTSTGEYDFESGRTMLIVVDFDMVRITGEDEGLSRKAIDKNLTSVAVEEGIHATQTFVDLGKYFKQGMPGNYKELSKDTL